MPPTYYQWAMNRPCTTNQTYGYELRGGMAKSAQQRSTKPRHSSHYARPFSSAAFLPEIPDKRRNLTVGERQLRQAGVLDRTSPGTQNRFNINDGYTMGSVPVSSRVQQRKHPAGVRLVDLTTVPPAYVQPPRKEKDVILWHTLLGCLVHAKIPNNAQKSATCWKPLLRTDRLNCITFLMGTSHNPSHFDTNETRK